jgi:hypothetical protein
MKKVTHKLVEYVTGAVLYIRVSFEEWMDRIWSDGASHHWLITENGKDYYDHGISRAKSHQHAGNYPMASYAIGVSEGEVPAMREIDKKAGLNVEYDQGDPVFTSRGQRKKYLKAHGFHDRNSFDGN